MLTMQKAAAFARTGLKTVKALVEFGKASLDGNSRRATTQSALINIEPSGETQINASDWHMRVQDQVMFQSVLLPSPGQVKSVQIVVVEKSVITLLAFLSDFRK
jgi:hypothetical protein